MTLTGRAGETAPAAAETETKVEHVTAQEAAKRLAAPVKEKEKPLAVLDVRTPEEFKGGHIKGAKNVDFNDDGFEKELAKLDKERPVLVHCAAGGRSTRSLKILKKLGFKTVLHLDGGINAWKEAGLPLSKDEKRD